ncbi:hypothetical protein RND71_019166 [Anisodus tanguticus]|uniref:Uncharacterized protein n=1 Tax=Anisodus tanguticus TaxID=243964 RepID=A0AAE1RZP8_9SOLA|nr:hypothetical protein RND71_019166 [Anisodus tanguticus]
MSKYDETDNLIKRKDKMVDPVPFVNAMVNIYQDCDGDLVTFLLSGSSDFLSFIHILVIICSYMYLPMFLEKCLSLINTC